VSANFDKGLIGWTTFIFAAAAHQYHPAFNLIDDLLTQTGFADTGLTTHQHNLTLTVLRQIPQFEQMLDFLFSPKNLAPVPGDPFDRQLDRSSILFYLCFRRSRFRC
jgi:hypothetical protein